MEPIRFKPSAYWLLDDTSPFQDYSGYNGVATLTGTETRGVPVVADASYSQVIDSTRSITMSAPVYIAGKESEPFTLIASVYPARRTAGAGALKIFNTSGNIDGITIDGTVVSFATEYATTGQAKCSFDIERFSKINIAAVHTSLKNSLYINGELVAEVDITEAQQADTYDKSGTNLYVTTTTRLAGLVNGLGVYNHALQPEEIRFIHDANNRVATGSVSKAYGGDTVVVSSQARPAAFDVWWRTNSDWESASLFNVSAEDGQLAPQMFDGIITAGEWKDSIELYYGDTATTLNSVVPNWDGINVRVYTSINGTTWTEAFRGVPLSNISSGFSTSGKTLNIKAVFTEGEAEGYLQNLNFRGYATSSYTQTFGRTITYVGAGVLNEYPPHLLSDDWGVVLDDGTLTVSTMSGYATKSVEMWVKNIGPTAVTFSSNLTSTTKYVNGVAGSTLPIGEWVVMHFTSGSTIAGDITVSGDVQIGKVVHYENTLTAPQIATIVRNSFGIEKTAVDDATPVNVSESSTGANIYAYDWQIVAS